MSLLLRGAAGLALSALVVSGLAPAQADNLEALGDELQGSDHVALGTLCAGDSATTATTFKLVRNGNEGPQVWDSSTTVTITPGSNPSTARGVLTLGSTSASTSSDWLVAAQNASVTSGAASIGIAVPDNAPTGAGSATVTYTALGKGVSGGPVGHGHLHLDRRGLCTRRHDCAGHRLCARSGCSDRPERLVHR
jgi:hypothetical protein